MNPEDPLKSLSFDYLNLLINGQVFSDVTFTVEGREVHAHKCILAARSPFFRMIFCNNEATNEQGGRAATSGATPIPVGVVGYEVFMLVLQFLYSGQASITPQKHETRSRCSERGCWHTHCTSAIDLALDTLTAAHFFGVEQLSIITQKQLGSMVEKASIEDVTRVLLAARKQDLQYLWNTCSHLVAKSGLPSEVLTKHLPADVTAKIEEIRLKYSSYERPFRRVLAPNEGSSSSSSMEMEDQRMRRMQRALDSSDVELVRLMVMGEGLNLDKALALHYAVANCSREVVKALLELGAADVNHPGPEGKMALHIAAEMVNPDMVAVLLDHHANPNVRTYSGATPFDILQYLASEFLSKGGGMGIPHVEHNKLRLCLELLQSAALVLSRDEDESANTSLKLQVETTAMTANPAHITSSSVAAFPVGSSSNLMQGHSGSIHMKEGSNHLGNLDSRILFLNLSGQLDCKDGGAGDINPAHTR
ncbi:hypothetical protein SUGI_0060900 [Cryptomeria japonica]|uniref:BTB/POZ domain and ankyrin repeat-containing protein NOOT1 n=1 Tax=Cryptomeria japonica TaxID=3369 RepID=UPI002408D412|nr:BTB/POZ domain and ankyrin repeat-containing protein NOOT1 [Cryptomeria japonica]GLJ07186.1 hypothetical protein SUGI_0060900 [Cryptomeria japonica]